MQELTAGLAQCLQRPSSRRGHAMERHPCVIGVYLGWFQGFLSILGLESP